LRAALGNPQDNKPDPQDKRHIRRTYSGRSARVSISKKNFDKQKAKNKQGKKAVEIENKIFGDCHHG
jgi:hypothetical protein